MISSPLILKLSIIVLLIGGLTLLARSSHVKGWFGELVVNLLARFFLDKKTYHLLYNVTLPTEDSSTEVDHIIVSKYGLFVVEIKNMNGWIFGDESNADWTLQKYKLRKNFQNPLNQHCRHTKALEEILGLMPNRLFSVIVFVGDCTFKTVMPENVTNVGGYIRYIKSKTEPLFGEFEVKDIVKKIEDYRLDPGLMIHKIQVENLKNQHSRKIKRKLRRAKRQQSSTLYKCTIIAVLILLFIGVAKKTILNKRDAVDQQEVMDEITDRPVQPQDSKSQKGLDKIYQYRDVQGKIRYTNDATAPNAKLVKENKKIAAKPVPVEIDADKVLIPVTILNKGAEMETTLIFDDTVPITIFPMTMADFFEAEKLGAATVNIARGKMIKGEKRRVSYFAIGDIVEPNFIFLATDKASFARKGTLGGDFTARHPFSIDHDNKMLVWQ